MRYTPNFAKNIYDISPIWSRNIFSSSYGFLKTRKERNKEFSEIVDFLFKSQWWDVNKLEDLQNEKLKELINHCINTVPYYQNMFAEYGYVASQFQNKSDLKKLPILTKQIVRNEFKSLLSNSYKKYRTESTSGTTGTPLSVAINSEALLWNVATVERFRSWIGYDFGQEWVAILNGYKILPNTRKQKPFWIKNYYNKQIHFSAYHLKNENILNYYNVLAKHNIKYIIGYPSTVSIIAKLLLNKNITFDLKGVWLSSEPIYDWQVLAIKTCFNCNIYSRYGQSENVISAATCVDSNLNMHLDMERGISEIIKYENDVSKLIGTSLVNYAMPLIRYALNDITSTISRKCKCGRNLELIGSVQTKSEDIIITPDGNFISPSLLTFPFKELKGVEEAQIIQYTPQEIQVNLVATELFNSDIEKKLINNLSSCIGSSIKIKVEKVSSIERTKNGKFRFVISKLEKVLENNVN